MALFILHILILYYLSDSFSMISRSRSPSCFFCPLILTHGETMWIRDLGKINLPCHHSACTSLSPFCLVAHRLELSFPGRGKKEQNHSMASRGFLLTRMDLRSNGRESRTKRVSFMFSRSPFSTLLPLLTSSKCTRLPFDEVGVKANNSKATSFLSLTRQRVFLLKCSS